MGIVALVLVDIVLVLIDIVLVLKDIVALIAPCLTENKQHIAGKLNGSLKM